MSKELYQWDEVLGSKYMENHRFKAEVRPDDNDEFVAIVMVKSTHRHGVFVGGGWDTGLLGKYRDKYEEKVKSWAEMRLRTLEELFPLVPDEQPR